LDDEANVRSAAAQAFDVLQEELGAKAIDQTIPTLLEALRVDNPEKVLELRFKP
jgi:hypothetical protein